MAAPAMPAPDMSGVDPGLQPTLIALLYLFPALALAVLLVRFWRKWVDGILGGDDVLIAIAWILTSGNSVIVHLFCVAVYTGYHEKDVPGYAIDFPHAFKLQYALSVEYTPCVGFVKASFLWSLYKLRSRNPWIKRSIIALQVVSAAHMMAFTILAAIPCWPVAKSWQKDLPGGCYDPVDYVLSNISIVIITDFLVLLIPTWIIWDLQMPLKRKIITISFLSLGGVVIVIGIARFLWLLDAFKGKSKSYSVESAYSAIESSVAIIGTCGPTIKYILSRFIPALRPSFERSTANKNSYNTYGNHSGVAAKRGRSQYGTQSGYDDLDAMGAEQQEFEMKSEWQRKQGWNDDQRSDEQRITSNVNGISKTVEWTVHNGEDSQIGRAVTGELRVANGDPATSPTHIV